LLEADNNEHADVYLIDRITGLIERVSVTSDGSEIRFDSVRGMPSDDGRLIAFESRGPMHPDATQPPGWVSPNVFLRDRLLGQTTFVSPDVAGQVPFFAVTLRDADASQSEVLLQTPQQLLNPGGDPLLAQTNLYLRNWDTGSIELVSVAAGGGLANGSSNSSRIISGGRHILFSSTATNLPAAPGPGTTLYLRDRHAGTTTRLLRPWHGGEFAVPLTLDLRTPRATPDARHIAFASTSRELLAEDAKRPSLSRQVYVLDRQTGVLERLSKSTTGEPANAPCSSADISDDARYATFYCEATNLPAGGRAIYALDRWTGQLAVVGAELGSHIGAPPNLDLARDGSAIAFSWRSADPASPYFDRLLVFTAELRGAPPAQPAVPVPLSTLWLPGLIIIALLMAGWRLGLSGFDGRTSQITKC
jgi:hypothetical protein